MKIIIFAILLATATASGLQGLHKTVNNIKWTDCDGTGAQYLDITAFTVTGEVKAGNTVDVDIQGNNKQSFDIYSISVQVYASGFKVYTHTYNVDPPQHLNKGPGEIKLSPALPIAPPNANYKTIAQIRDRSGNELQCILVTFTLA